MSRPPRSSTTKAPAVKAMHVSVLCASRSVLVGRTPRSRTRKAASFVQAKQLTARLPAPWTCVISFVVHLFRLCSLSVDSGNSIELTENVTNLL